MTVRDSSSGFTMIELMVTIAVVAILLTVAAPSFRSYIANQQVRSTASDLLATMNFARSEAVKRNTDVTVTPVTADDWSDGWTVSTVADGTLRSYGSQHAITVDDGAGGVPADVTYGGNGRLIGAASNLEFQVTEDPDIPLIDSRCVRIGLSGKPRVTKGDC